MGSVDYEYDAIVATVLSYGIPKGKTRGGVNTISHFGLSSFYKEDGYFPLLTSKKISWKNIVVENMWFLSGSNKLDFLHKHGVHFWDDWQLEDGTVPSAYGYFWRQFENTLIGGDKYVGYGDPIEDPIDQVQWALDKLQKDPNTRQACISSWDPRNVVESSLPPCHSFHVLNISGADQGDPRLNLHLTQRSADVALGVPYNIAGYALLQNIYARILGVGVGDFSHLMVDAHIYTGIEDGDEYDHRPNLETQLIRENKISPFLIIDDRIQTLKDIEELIRDGSTKDFLDTFKLIGYDPHPAVNFKAAV